MFSMTLRDADSQGQKEVEIGRAMASQLNSWMGRLPSKWVVQTLIPGWNKVDKVD